MPLPSDYQYTDGARMKATHPFQVFDPEIYKYAKGSDKERKDLATIEIYVGTLLRIYYEKDNTRWVVKGLNKTLKMWSREYLVEKKDFSDNTTLIHTITVQVKRSTSTGSSSRSLSSLSRSSSSYNSGSS